jgi:hypothetical protein
VKTLEHIVLLVLVAVSPQLFGQSQTPDETAAEAVAKTYFQALSQGDVQTLESVIMDPLLAKRKPLFENPDYPADLTTTYASASFTINKISTIDPSTIAIDISISFGPNDFIDRKLLLRRVTLPNSPGSNYYIFAEQSLD